MGRKRWEKEKLLVTSNFSFFHSVFKSLVSRASKGVIIFEWVNPFPHNPNPGNDFNLDLCNILLFVKVLNFLFQQRMAQEILTTLKEHPDAWTRVDTILEYSSNQQTKYYALQILENVIKTRWKVLPRPQCEGIKKYIVGLIIKTSSDASTLEREKTYLGKMNMILVQVNFVQLSHILKMLLNSLLSFIIFDVTV